MTAEIQPGSLAVYTRKRLLDAGQTLFSSQGYSATSMRQVADKAGLALGGIYNHFSSKEAIFQAILLEATPLRQLCMGSVSEYRDWLEIKNLLEELENQPEFINVFLIELLEFKGVHLAERFKDIPPSIRIVLSLMVSYHVTHILLASTLPPDLQRQASLDTFLDDFLTCIKIPE